MDQSIDTVIFLGVSFSLILGLIIIVIGLTKK